MAIIPLQQGFITYILFIMHLVINKFGSTIYVKSKKFEVRNKEGQHFFAPNQVESITLMRGIKLTTDAINLAVANDIDIVVLNRAGEPLARVWSNRYGSVSTIRKQQVWFSESIDAAQWIKTMINYKVQSQIALLKSLSHDRPAKKDMIGISVDFLKRIDSSVTQVDISSDNFRNQFRGLEGNASKAYFKTLSAIVPAAYEFDKRSRRPAKDMFNAMLNYMYGILYARVEGSLIKAGLDPYLGIFHRDDYNKPVLAFDMIERYRVWADTVALRLCIKKIPQKSMFSKQNGGYWLETPGKKVVIETFNDYMDEIIQFNHRRRSRLNHIQADMHEFAKYLENNDFKNSPRIGSFFDDNSIDDDNNESPF